jgi:hypothetical protein
MGVCFSNPKDMLQHRIDKLGLSTGDVIVLSSNGESQHATSPTSPHTPSITLPPSSSPHTSGTITKACHPSPATPPPPVSSDILSNHQVGFIVRYPSSHHHHHHQDISSSSSFSPLKIAYCQVDQDGGTHIIFTDLYQELSSPYKNYSIAIIRKLHRPLTSQQEALIREFAELNAGHPCPSSSSSPTFSLERGDGNGFRNHMVPATIIMSMMMQYQSGGTALPVALQRSFRNSNENFSASAFVAIMLELSGFIVPVVVFGDEGKMMIPRQSPTKRSFDSTNRSSDNDDEVESNSNSSSKDPSSSPPSPHSTSAPDLNSSFQSTPNHDHPHHRHHHQGEIYVSTDEYGRVLDGPVMLELSYCVKVCSERIRKMKN